MNTDEATRPDLTGLTYEDRVCIAVAETQAARWRIRADRCWALVGGPIAMRTPVIVLPHGRLHNRGRLRLPRYTTDPAAWGVLLNEELCGVRQQQREGPWCASWRGQSKTGFAHILYDGPWAPTIGMAVCLAALAKHGITVEP